MWMQFTRNAIQAVSEGQEEATRANSRYVTPDHIFAGLLRDRSSVAASVLSHLEVDIDGLLVCVRNQIRVSQAPKRSRFFAWTNSMPLTPRAKRSIDLAYDEAQKLGSNYIGTEHLLLGLLREKSTVATKAVCGAGVDLAKTRVALAKIQRAAALPDVPPPDDEFRVNRTGDPWSHFTERVRVIIYAAIDEARQRGARAVEPEHVLLAVTGEHGAETSASGVFQRLDLSAPTIHASLDSRLHSDNPIVRTDTDPASFSERFVTVVNLACDEADRTRQPAVGTDHLLLGILREHDSLAFLILTEVGMNLEAARLVFKNARAELPS